MCVVIYIIIYSYAYICAKVIDRYRYIYICISFAYVQIMSIYNVVIWLPFKSCGNQAMPCLHFFHGSFYISTILREQWPMTKVWKFPLHPALQFGTDPGLKGWTYPSLWESDGERTNEFLLAIGDFERLDLLSACSLATTHCHAWSTVDICWHLLTSVDICWHLLTIRT